MNGILENKELNGDKFHQIVINIVESLDIILKTFVELIDDNSIVINEAFTVVLSSLDYEASYRNNIQPTMRLLAKLLDLYFCRGMSCKLPIDQIISKLCEVMKIVSSRMKVEYSASISLQKYSFRPEDPLVQSTDLLIVTCDALILIYSHSRDDNFTSSCQKNSLSTIQALHHLLDRVLPSIREIQRISKMSTSTNARRSLKPSYDLTSRSLKSSQEAVDRSTSSVSMMVMDAAARTVILRLIGYLADHHPGNSVPIITQRRLTFMTASFLSHWPLFVSESLAVDKAIHNTYIKASDGESKEKYQDLLKNVQSPLLSCACGYVIASQVRSESLRCLSRMIDKLNLSTWLRIIASDSSRRSASVPSSSKYSRESSRQRSFLSDKVRSISPMIDHFMNTLTDNKQCDKDLSSDCNDVIHRN